MLCFLFSCLKDYNFAAMQQPWFLLHISNFCEGITTWVKNHCCKTTKILSVFIVIPLAQFVGSLF
uniref:Uncharacterized protein n=1 Tax=Octopus bimaculoides TaxID=37653 RepID=A0A0L8FNV7_OCTBM